MAAFSRSFFLFCLCNQEGTHHVQHHSGALGDRGEEEEHEEEGRDRMHGHCRRAAQGRRPEGSDSSADIRELQVDQVRSVPNKIPYHVIVATT